MQRHKLLISAPLILLISSSMYVLTPTTPVVNSSKNQAQKIEIKSTQNADKIENSSPNRNAFANKSRNKLQNNSAKLAAERKAIFAVNPAKPNWPLINAALQSKNHTARFIAVQKLSEIQSRKSLLKLIHAVRDMNSTVSNGAVAGIEKLCGYQLPANRPITQLGRNLEADLVLRWLSTQSGKSLLAMRRDKLQERSG